MAIVSAVKFLRSFFPAEVKTGSGLVSLPSMLHTHRFILRQLTELLLTWEADTLHLVSVVTPQRGVEPLEVGVSAGDDGWRLIAAARLDHMDGVQLERDGDRTSSDSSVGSLKSMNECRKQSDL